MNINNLREELQNITDKLGKKIDEKIFESVLYLNAYEFKTTGSCEGHSDHGLAYPWIDFSSAGNNQNEKINEISDELRKLLVETGNDYNNEKVLEKKREQDKLTSALLKNNSDQINKLISLLDEFYSNKLSSSDNRLIIVDRVISFRLQSQGGILQSSREDNEKKSKLEEYQKEIMEFTNFLKSKLDK